MSLCWLGWGRVNFLHGSLVWGWSGFVLEAVDNSGMFGSLLSRADTAKAFLGAHLTPAAQRLSTADPRDIPGLGHHAQSGNLGLFTLPQVPWDGQTLPIHGKWIPLLFLYVWLFFSLLDYLYLQPGHPSVSLSPSWMAPWMRLKAFPTADCNEKILSKTLISLSLPFNNLSWSHFNGNFSTNNAQAEGWGIKTKKGSRTLKRCFKEGVQTNKNTPSNHSE